MKQYLQKYGLRIGIIIAAAALIIGLGAAARDGRIGFVQNMAGVLKSPIQKVLSSAVNWFDSIYGYLYDYDALLAENESLRMQLAEAQQSAREGIEASEENVRLREALELRQAHHVEVIPPDALHQQGPEALDAVGPGLVHGLAGGYVVTNFLLR